MDLISLIFITILGLAVGSFLNVVIVRYPKILEAQWQQEYQLYLHQSSEAPHKPSYTLARPSSHCPFCQTPLKWWHNIPVISFILLKGKCSFCQQTISWQYPLVELLSGGLSLWAALHLGIDSHLIWSLIFIWILLAIAWIDFQTQLIPDDMVLPLLWLGLLVNIQHGFAPLSQAVVGAVVGYLFLWIIAKLFKWIRKKEGMGHGDFKMLACLGAWFGVQMVPILLLIAVFLSLFASLFLLLLKKINWQQLIPFGPFLAISGWLALMFGNHLIDLAAKLF